MPEKRKKVITLQCVQNFFYCIAVCLELPYMVVSNYQIENRWDNCYGSIKRTDWSQKSLKNS